MVGDKANGYRGCYVWQRQLDAEDEYMLQRVWVARGNYEGSQRCVKCGSERDAGVHCLDEDLIGMEP